jgi:hypothetical protein
VLRIETTTSDVSFFKHHRKVELRHSLCEDERDAHDNGALTACSRDKWHFFHELFPALTGSGSRQGSYLMAERV